MILTCLIVLGVSLLWPEDHIGGVRSHSGQEQPPRTRPEHAVHPLDWRINTQVVKRQPIAIRIYFVRQLPVKQVVDLALFIIFKIVFALYRCNL